MKRIFRICLTAALAFPVLVPVCGTYTQAVQTVYAESGEGWQEYEKV